MSRITTIVLVPVVLRAALVPFIDDFDADGYSRVLVAQQLAEALLSGTFDWTMLYIPAWMPAWHLLCGAVQMAVPEPYYVPKLLSALFGGLSPALVFLMARRMGRKESTGWIAWAIATLLPLHLLYSTASMTEAFSGFWILLAAFALLRAEPRNGWLLISAVALLPAALTRYEAWALLLLLPPLAILQRRARPTVLVLSTAILALGPLIWFAINLEATGNPLGFLGSHRSYIAHLFEFYPALADRGPLGLARHIGAIAAAGSVTVTALGLYGFLRTRNRDTLALAAIVGALLSFMFLLWALHLQVGYMRHYMTVGLFMATTAALALESLPHKRLAVTVLAIELTVLALAYGQGVTWSDRLREAAVYVRQRPGTIYCDEPGVKVLSGLPLNRFVDGHGMERTPERAIEFMRDRGVHWVVYAHADYSPLPELFPPMRSGENAPPFRLVYTPPSKVQFLPTIQVYELDPAPNGLKVNPTYDPSP